MTVRAEWHGAEAKARAQNGGLTGLRAAGEELLGISRSQVPWDEGTLGGTGATDDNGRDALAVSYDTVYARRQHEELTWRHKPGRRAKYLEGPLNENDSHLRRIVAAGIAGKLS